MDFERLPNLTGLLQMLEPSALQELKTRFPDSASLLVPGQEWGGGKKSSSGRTQVLSLSEGIALALETLRASVKKASSELNTLNKRFTWISRIGLAGDASSLVGSSGVIAAVIALSNAPLHSAKSYTALGAAVLALVGTLASSATKWLRRDPLGEEDSLAKHYRNLQAITWEAGELIRKLDVLSRRAFSDLESAKVAAMVLRAEELASQFFVQLRLTNPIG